MDADDDDAVQLPDLDDEGAVPDAPPDFGEHEGLAFDEEDAELTPDLEDTWGSEPLSGADVDLIDDQPPLGADLEAAEDLVVPDDEGIGLVEGEDSGPRDPTQDHEGFPVDEEGDGGLIAEWAPAADLDDGAVGFDNGLDDSAQDLALPPLDDPAEAAIGADGWGQEDGSSARARATPRPGPPTEPVAPGLRWPRLRAVEVQRLARPKGRPEPCPQAVCSDAPVLFLGAMYRIENGTLRLLPAQGLSRRPLALVASAGVRPWLWALFDDAVQLSRDGGRRFEPPVALPSRGTTRGAATANGTLWVAHAGELYRLATDDRSPQVMARDEPPVDVVGDGRRGILLIADSGRLFLSKDAGRSFSAMPGLSGAPQAVHLCGGVALMACTGGLWLADEDDCRQVFPVTVQACALSQIEDALFAYACVRSEPGWLLVRFPVWTGGPGVVLARLGPELGAPRFVSATHRTEHTVVLVGADRALMQIQVPLGRG